LRLRFFFSILKEIFCAISTSYFSTVPKWYHKLGFVDTILASNLKGVKTMSKYNFLWEYVQNTGSQFFKMTFDEIQSIAGIPIDHSFLKYKKELAEYGYQVGKISIKEQTVFFNKID